MTAEHWQQLETLFQAALELPSEARAAYLAQACANDAELLREAQKLLASFDSAASFLDTPAINSLGLSGTATILPGQRIAHYEIISALGAGGMGEVYLARDTRLERQVALKLLPAHFNRDAVWVERFKREARATSALNHPNILTIHEIGEDGGKHFMAAEYVTGQTLRQKLKAGHLPFDESINIAIQIARALSAAHAAGILHRDIKPENVMLRPDGLVKVLDFGLAKPVQLQNADDSMSPGTTKEDLASANSEQSLATDPRFLLGTMAYLSPEQARHESLDARSDIFSLGIVMHEMLAGARPKNGLTALNEVAPDLSHIVTRALAPAREHRYQTAADVSDALEQVKQRLLTQPATTRRKRAAAVLTALSFIALSVWGWREWRIAPSPALVFNEAAQKLTDAGGEEFFPSLSPDGQTLVYSARSDIPGSGLDIFWQTVGTRHAVNLTPNSPGPDNQPVFSPDGSRIAFRSAGSGAGIFVMNSDGSQITKITDAGFNPAWSPDGREIVLADEMTWNFEGRMTYPHVSHLWAVNVETRVRRLVTDQDAVQPNWSPHGHRIAFWSVRRGGHRDLWTVAAEGGTPVPVTDDASVDWNPVWSPTGEHLYFLSNRGGEMNMWRIAVDERTGVVRGQPEAAPLPSGNCQYIGFARNGKALVYTQLTRSENIWQLPFDAVQEQVIGAPVPITEGLKRYAHFEFSPDDQSFVYLARGEPQADIFTADRSGKLKQRLTDDAAQDLFPRWSPDGNWIAFVSDRDGESGIWQIKPDGTGLAPLIYAPGQEAIAPVWSPDGRRLLYQVRNDKAYIRDVYALDPAQATHALAGALPPDLLFRDWSPDGKWLVGALAPTAQQARGIVVYSFEQQSYHHILTAGDSPLWLNDNRRLLVRLNNGICLTDRTGAKPRLLHAINPLNQLSQYGLSLDNRRIYYSETKSEADIWLLKLH